MSELEKKCMKEAEAIYRKLDPKQPAFAGASEQNWSRIAREYRHAPATMGDFYFHLCEAIVKADLANSTRLKAAYPELVHWIQDVDL